MFKEESTFISHVALIPLSSCAFASMCAVPFVFAVTVPSWLTIATSSLSLFHVIFLFIASFGYKVASNLKVWFGFNILLFLFNVIFLTSPAVSLSFTITLLFSSISIR